MLRVEGLGLRAADAGRTLSMPGGARGTVSDSRGVRLAGGEQGGETRFRCAGELLLALRPPAAGAAPAPGREAWRLVLDREAVVEQASGRLSADRVEIDVLRPTGREGGDTVVESVRAEGAVALEGTGRGRDLRAAGSSLRARPLEGGATEVYLDGEPVVAVREVEGGPSGRSVEVRGRSPARFAFPEADGPVAAWFRGGAVATFVEPGAKEGDPPLHRDLSASSLAIRARREGERTLLEEVLAEGEAVLREGGRTARADRALYRPLEGGASLTRLEGAVAVSWPDAGALDPLAALSPGEAPEGSPGVLLLSTPGRVVVELPPGSDATTGAHFAADGGVTLRRAVGEREVYRLTCASADARLHPGSRGIATLAAAGSVRLDGREEGPSGRAYALAGDALDVRGDPSTREARTAEVRGTPGKARAEASFTGEDGRPFSVAADVLRFDRATGEFRAEGGVRGKGVLPEGGGAGLPGGKGGAAEIACGSLEGRLAGVGAGKGAEGGTRVLALTARDAVSVSTARERATGEALAYDAAEGTVLLRGDPAKVIATSQDAAAELGLVDRFESPAMALRIRDGELLEARADEGGLLVSHRAAGTAKGSPPPERYEARCRGPLLHVPGSTTLRGGVTLVHSRWKDGAFRPAERLEGAEEISVLHPPGRAAAAKVERAIATSGRGGIEIASEEDGWRADGVSKVDFDPSGSALLLESSPGAPRFRVRSADGLMTCRRITFDYVRGTFREGVGVTIEGGGR
jgi:hypothetical protein